MRRRLVLMLALAAVAFDAPSAIAQPAGSGPVRIVDASVPALTVADHAFPASVRLRNDGAAAETVDLIAALYRWDASKSPCGPQSDPHFVGYTPLVQARVAVPAGGEVAYPGPNATWMQRYPRGPVPDETSDGEWCVFAAREQSTSEIAYEDFRSVRLRIRGFDEPPTGSFTYAPGAPRAAEDVTFRAQASDPEGDPVTFLWDFGHANASGRSPVEGAVAIHFFYPEGDYGVTLTITDGFESTTVSRVVHVASEGARANATATPPASRAPLPWPGAPAWLAALILAALLRPRRK